MGTITVVRVEKDGVGIFCNDTIIYTPEVRSIYRRHSEDFPNPMGEGLEFDDDWFCAYKTVDQFKEWVRTDEMIDLIEQGFRAYMIEVSNFQEGEYQVIYTKDSIVTKTDITNIFIH